MRYQIYFAPEASEDLKSLRANLRSEVKEAVETHLRYEPTKVSKSRIKRLRQMAQPQYRLRVGSDIRVFYDVVDARVEILAIVSKSQAASWLKERGTEL